LVVQNQFGGVWTAIERPLMIVLDAIHLSRMPLVIGHRVVDVGAESATVGDRLRIVIGAVDPDLSRTPAVRAVPARRGGPA
jgi:hypothetical protein